MRPYPLWICYDTGDVFAPDDIWTLVQSSVFFLSCATSQRKLGTGKDQQYFQLYCKYTAVDMYSSITGLLLNFAGTLTHPKDSDLQPANTQSEHPENGHVALQNVLRVRLTLVWTWHVVIA